MNPKKELLWGLWVGVGFGFKVSGLRVKVTGFGVQC